MIRNLNELMRRQELIIESFSIINENLDNYAEQTWNNMQRAALEAANEIEYVPTDISQGVYVILIPHKESGARSYNQYAELLARYCEDELIGTGYPDFTEIDIVDVLPLDHKFAELEHRDIQHKIMSAARKEIQYAQCDLVFKKDYLEDLHVG